MGRTSISISLPLSQGSFGRQKLYDEVMKEYNAVLEKEEQRFNFC